MPVFPTATRRRKLHKVKEEANPGLTRDAIVAATIELIDNQGLENFSVRNVAKELGIYPTAIYWHIPDRNALVTEVIASVLADLVPEDEPVWQDWLRALFRRYRAAIRRHPNVAPLVGVQLVSNAAVDFNMIEAILSKLESLGFSGKRLVAAYNAVIVGMVGFTNQEFAMVPPERPEEWRESMKQTIASADASTFPVFVKNRERLANKSFILRWDNGVDAPLDSGFDLYVDALIIGLEALGRKR